MEREVSDFTTEGAGKNAGVYFSQQMPRPGQESGRKQVPRLRFAPLGMTERDTRRLLIPRYQMRTRSAGARYSV